ncbi:MAG: hypothetical protein J7K47_02075 [Thermoplasmata archaeon]|nr:hypothetical protein [Thermoplasmata archaeon]
MERARLAIYMLLFILLAFTIFEFIAAAMFAITVVCPIIYFFEHVPLEPLTLIMTVSIIVAILELVTIILHLAGKHRIVKYATTAIFIYFTFITFVNTFLFASGDASLVSLNIILPFALSYATMVLSFRYP